MNRMQHEATRKKIKHKKMQLKKSAPREKCKTKTVHHVKSATRENCSMKERNVKKVQHENNAT